MTKNPQGMETALITMDSARKALRSGDRKSAWKFYYNVCTRHLPLDDTREGQAMYMDACLNLSQLGFILGKNVHELTLILLNAHEKAERMGDRRSRALVNLHLGRLYYFSQRRVEASRVFEKGTREAESLGDEDILIRASEFIGLYYFTQGQLKKATHYFDMGLESYEVGSHQKLINVQTPMWAGYCAAFMGLFSRAVGTVDYYRRFCLETGDLSSAAILRAVLGIVLLMARKYKDALYHLKIADLEAEQNQNPLARYFAGGGLAYHAYATGALDQAHGFSETVMQNAREMGIQWQYASPIFLEMFHGLYRSGMTRIIDLAFKDEVARLLGEPNILMKGVALRLRALNRIEMEERFAQGKKDLELSLENLEQSGASIQLAKTLIEMARVSLIEGKTDQARQYANTAARELGGHIKKFYPDDLLYLLRSPGVATPSADPGKSLLMKFMDVIRMMEPATDLDVILHRVVRAVNRLFGAERGGVVWFGSRPGRAPRLRASHNLTETDLQAQEFRENLAAIFETHKTGRPRLVHKEDAFAVTAAEDRALPCRSMLCLPIPVNGKSLGVLYYDNSYMDHRFEVINPDNLDEISLQLGGFVERLSILFRKFRDRQPEQPAPRASRRARQIITQCPAMEQIIDQGNRIARTDSSILILGETGVGKELYARHIHHNSLRAGMPFVVIDPSTMPENLVESELFGHEKGAFTGADRQRKGRLEMADKGTLFIDEIGDIPLSIQVKLLRALQEKTITRVGGTQEINSDFRLIAATHRDLERMVAEGRFREDLYYRINVVPMVIPPLRDRQEDIAMLARYYLDRYGAKYHNRSIKLSKNNEAVLRGYHWPGNIRELKNVMERTVLLSHEETPVFDLPRSRVPKGENPFEDLPTMDEIQKRYILHVLEQTKGKQSGPGGAARILGMNRSTLYNRMKKLGIPSR